jgi:hypothetical protein
LPKAARVRPRALDAENDLVTLEEQGNPALLSFQLQLFFATRFRRLAEKTQAKLAALGTINPLRYKGTEQDGSDVYEGEFSKSRAQFRLLFQEDGKIAGVSFNPDP